MMRVKSHNVSLRCHRYVEVYLLHRWQHGKTRHIGLFEMRHMGRREMVQCVVYDEASLKTGVLAFYDIYLSYSILYGLFS